MQIGRTEIVEQVAQNHVAKISKVENLEKEGKVDPDDQYKNLSEQVNKIEDNEVILDNVKFGYNKELNEFFVRITSDGVDQQFPTEQIMKMKADFLEQINRELT
jgi:uncharacterized FlaG/YvyC family protein